MNQPGLRNAGDEPINEVALFYAGYAVFGAGVAVGLTNIASGYDGALLLEFMVSVSNIFTLNAIQCLGWHRWQQLCARGRAGRLAVRQDPDR